MHQSHVGPSHSRIADTGEESHGGDEHTLARHLGHEAQPDLWIWEIGRNTHIGIQTTEGNMDSYSRTKAEPKKTTNIYT